MGWWVGFYCLLLYLSLNKVRVVIIWYSIFISMLFLMTVFKYNWSQISALFYYVCQEIGVVFFIRGALLRQKFCCLALLFKVGVSPLHVWVFLVMGNTSSWAIVVFSRLHKPVHVIILSNFLWEGILIVLFFGLGILFYQANAIKRVKGLILLSSLESLSWFSVKLCFDVFISSVLFWSYVTCLCGFYLGLRRPYLFNSPEAFVWNRKFPFRFSFSKKLFLIGESLNRGVFLIVFFMMLSSKGLFAQFYKVTRYSVMGKSSVKEGTLILLLLTMVLLFL